jgi:hypothetical protein
MDPMATEVVLFLKSGKNQVFVPVGYLLSAIRQQTQ